MRLLSGKNWTVGGWVTLCLLPVACGWAQESPEAKAAAGTKLFVDHVRTVLIHQCVECHAGATAKGDFDITTREKLMDSGYVGETAAESHLLDLIEHKAEPHMPHKAPKLKPEQIAQIRQWIDLGAPYDRPLLDAKQSGPKVVTEQDREFWSFKPLAAGSVPATPEDTWSRSPIDQFVRAKQAAQGIHPNSTANRRILIKRVYADLLGLPPSYDEVQAFVNDSSPQAYEKLVDRLLESPHFGERWARHWLDVARFGESHGYEQDYDRPHAYHYRDFVIRAFNEDLPFNQFVSWQLAGDELAPDNPEALKATGFMGAGVFPTQLTEEEFESARYDELDDMLATTGVAFLGLSIGCARCHDHKFDPIPVKDYYELASSFTKTIRSEIDMDLDPAANQQAREQYAAQLALLKRARTEVEQALAGEFQTYLATPADPAAQSPWELPGSVQLMAANGSQYGMQTDGAWLTSGTVPPTEELTISGTVQRQKLTALRLEALMHESLPAKGPGRAGNGNFVVSHIQLAVIDKAGNTKPITLIAARATHQQNADNLSVAASLDADPATGWAVDMGGIGKDQAAVFDLTEPLTLGPEERLVVTLKFLHPNPQHSLGKFRLTVTDLPQPEPTVGQSGPAADVLAALDELRKAAADQRSPQHPAWNKAFAWYLENQAAWIQVDQPVKELEKSGPQVKLTKVMVTSEGYPHIPHHADGRGFPHFYPETHYLTRGDVRQKGEVAQPGFLQVLMRNGKTSADWRVEPPADWKRTSFRRAALANWLTDDKDGAGHLVARVIVNRLWQHHFGRGLVSTPNDFGYPGERPTHPELLDWLAQDLIDNGWKLKRLHKLMLLSSTYQQSGDWDEARASVDRENTLFWRRAPQRLEGEAIRDSLLQAAGRLDSRMYGPGTLDQNMTRRSVYFFVKRSQLIPMMMLFDWPESLVSIGQRPNTTVAPQALMFLNSPQGRSYAEALTQHVTAKAGESAPLAERIQAAYRATYSRDVEPQEAELALEFVAQQAQLYRNQNFGNAEQLALTDLCQALLSANEFCYVE